jgi:hypothetical protein
MITMIKHTLIQAIEDLPEETMTDVLSDVFNYLQVRLNRSTQTQESASIDQLLNAIRRDREALPAQTHWLDSTALIREDRDR